ncbi:MAG: ABC transporter ATP-binding protein [Acidobacteriota bacterium]|jgi:lipopolysaccharide transport system ATP-binding protein
MSPIALRAEGLGKCYRLGRRDRYATLREALLDATAVPWRVLRGARPRTDILWALREVGFEVRQGEVVGIIGRNGAGKSTLLKVLSRITEPTEGEARIRGRIGSLLEVGTGFHPELTGRENLYLNGAILGMSRAEIRRKFDEIVAFAEVERFLDTPVKRYSSGMYVRLAFAVAAHLETEILLVDEVLAVGDHRFQRKCLGKMGEIGKQGRTVLFVSHAMAAVQALCDRGIVLDAGRIVFDGGIEPAVDRYLRGDRSRAAVQDLTDVEGRKGGKVVRFTSFHVEDADGAPRVTVPNGKSCTFVLAYEVLDPAVPLEAISSTLSVRNVLGTRVFYHHNLLTGAPFRLEGRGEFRFHVPRLPLSAGDYQVDLHLSRDRGMTLLDAVEGVAGFEVCDGDFFGSGFEYRGGLNAAVMVDGSWEHRADAESAPMAQG